MLQDFFTQMGRVDVGVDLSGGNGFMSKHGLNGTQISPTLKQGGSEGVTERVGRDSLLNASLRHQILNHKKDHHPCQGFLTTMTDKDKILIFERNGQEITVDEVKLQLVDGFLRDRHEPLFRALSLHLDEFLIEEKIAE